jgi:hypothetical protein
MTAMKRDTMIYWIATGLLSLGLASAGFTYIASHRMDEAFRHFGFPAYFQIELGVAKIAAALALVLPFVPRGVKSNTYTCVIIVFVSALIAHLFVDGITTIITPLIAAGLWAVSAFFFTKINRGGSAGALNL